jgi:hypothetical protein
MPAGELLTVPPPSPAFATKSQAVSKVAVTEASLAAAMTQAPVPVQAPDQPTKTDLAAGKAVSVTVVPGR